MNLLRSTPLLVLPAILAGESIVLSTTSKTDPARFDLPTQVNVDEFPWSAIGKLYNGVGGSCTGVIVSQSHAVTAAHCIYSRRLGRFVSASALHFFVGYRGGKFISSPRIAGYKIGPGFHPHRSRKNARGDWALLQLTAAVPAQIAPLRLARTIPPLGTELMIAGYRRDRAHAMTVGRNCRLTGESDGGRILIHSCRGYPGYSGAPLLYRFANNEFQVVGIHISATPKGKANRSRRMIAISAQSIISHGLE